MTTVYFVRHAESDLRHTAEETRSLSAQGRQDRALVTAYLSDKGIAHIFSSPYRRAMDTVRPLADALGLPVEIVHDFRERAVAPGCWIADFDSYARQQWEDFDYALPGGESLRQAQSRNVTALRGLLRQHAGQTLVIGSHGTALSAIIQYYDPTYGYADFERMQRLMPWIVQLTFAQEQCVGIATINLFAGEQVAIRR